MDFFEIQSGTRSRSRVLLVLFVLALLLLGTAIHFGITGLGVALGLFPSVYEPTPPVMALIGIVWCTVLLGSLFRLLDVRAGGAVLARRFGAVQASDRPRLPAEKALLNVVAELAVASSCRAPDAFVLRDESSINAFVVGASADKQAIVLTQGALDAFDRDELQAVVAHEFGHIAAGDVRLNMRLLIALGGLNALDEVGRLLVGKHPDEHWHPGVIVGYALRGVGSLGVLLGSLLRAAVSREREFLADASAVQFTRNPYALASALSLVAEADDDRPLHQHRSGELAHLCFAGGGRGWYRRLIASHPPIAARIRVIDPHFAIKRRKLEKQAAEAVRLQGVGGMAALAAQMSAGTCAEPARQSSDVSGNAGPALRLVDGTIEPTHDINDTGLSDRIVLLLPDERSCLAVLFCLFAPVDPLARAQYLDSVRFCFDDHFASNVKELLRVIPAELELDRLGIVEHATAKLATGLKPDNRRRVMEKLEALVRAMHGETLMNYATLQLVRRKLDVDFPMVRALADTGEAQGMGIKTFDAMGEEFALLLSLIVEASGADESHCEQHYRRVLSCYTNEALPRRRSDEPGVIAELQCAFQTLYVQPRPIRQAFVDHCIEIAQHDGRVDRREFGVLELFAASLGCQDFAPSAPAIARAHTAATPPLRRAA